MENSETLVQTIKMVISFDDRKATGDILQVYFISSWASGRTEVLSSIGFVFKLGPHWL